ncbi:MAG: hypothetical protein E7421_04840 [Ruminococcaceae bacterium]|nr:hypothetical protein [Oscillospiraceae bacterium]
MDLLADIFETLMILSFGISWPINVLKGYRSRTAKGKSVLFDYFILFGYFCGVASKIISHNYNLAFYFYFPNIIMVITDIIIYYRNRRLDAVRLKNEMK